LNDEITFVDQIKDDRFPNKEERSRSSRGFFCMKREIRWIECTNSVTVSGERRPLIIGQVLIRSSEYFRVLYPNWDRFQVSFHQQEYRYCTVRINH